jgi:hypothetical protein
MLWNYTNQTDCSIGYWKEVEAIDGTITRPPMGMTCAFPLALNKGWCGPNPQGVDSGVEFDWTNFYWQLQTQTANAFSWGEFNLLYQVACNSTCSGDATCNGICSGRHITITNLDTSARTVWGAGSAKYNYFRSVATAHGLL